MQQLDAWELPRQEVRSRTSEGGERAGRWQTTQDPAVDTSAAVTIPEFLRSRTRTRRRRRKRSWGALWAYRLPVLLIYGTFWIGPAPFSVDPSFVDWDRASPQQPFMP
jgi:hypothetical protein